MAAKTSTNKAFKPPSEHQEQCLVMQFWKTFHGSIPEYLLFAIPNGGKRNIITSTLLKAEGVRAGIPDIYLAYPAGEYHGLFIEMKKQNKSLSRLSECQKETLEVLSGLRYKVCVCHGADEAIREIIAYIKL